MDGPGRTVCEDGDDVRDTCNNEDGRSTCNGDRPGDDDTIGGAVNVTPGLVRIC